MHTSQHQSASIASPTNLSALTNLLREHGVDCSKWGRNGAKSIDELYNEISSGEARLSVTDRKLLREVRVVNIDVLAEDREGRLWRLREIRQVFEDGSERKRNTGTSVAEKVLGEEDLETAARRGLREEIGLRDHVELRAMAPIERLRPSDSYPGLESKFLVYPGFVRLNAAQRNSIVLKEQKNGKTTYFGWEPL